MIKFSVIIVAKNSAEELEFAVQSLLEQTTGDYSFEVILLESVSDDHGRTLTKLRDLHVKLSYEGIFSQVNALIKTEKDNEAYLFGASLANEDWVVFLPTKGFFDVNYLKNLSLTITKFYNDFDVLILNKTIVKTDNNKYRKLEIDNSIYINNIHILRECDAPCLSVYFGFCLKKSIISGLHVGSSRDTFNDMVNNDMKIAFPNVKVGTLIMGDNLDYRKRKNLFNELYYSAKG
ncbi:MAG: glycosyltransferase [Candidatus Pacearchaeota archaeon]